LIFTKLNWIDGKLVDDPVFGKQPNSVLEVVEDNTEKHVIVQSTVSIKIDPSKDYVLEWDAMVGGARGTGKNDYQVVIRQFDSDGKWIPHNNVPFSETPSTLNNWTSERKSISHTEWHADVETVHISFGARDWKNTAGTGSAWFDNVSFVEVGTTTNLVTNPTFDTVDSEDLSVELEHRAFDKAAQHAFDLGFDSMRLWLPYFSQCSIALEGCTDSTFLEWTWDSEDKDLVGDYAVAYQEIVRAIAEHLASEGWLEKSYAYWSDEPDSTWFDDVTYGMDILGKGAPDLKRLITLNHDFNDDKLEERIEIWVPQTENYIPPWAAERRANEDETWWYVSTGVKDPYSNNFIDDPGIDIRARFWSAWKYGVQGSLYWDTTYWNNGADCTNCQNPWKDAQSYTAKGGLFGNGDGRLFYPPRNWNQTSSPLIAGPVPSLRLELIREAIEDYEYLWMLSDAKDRLKASSPGHPLVSQAENLLSIPDTMITSLTEYATDPNVYVSYRRDVASTLVEILKVAPSPATPTPTPTATPNTPTPTLVTITPSITPSPTPTGTIGIHSPTATPSTTPTPTLVTITPSITPSSTPSPTPTPTLVTVTPSITPTGTPFFVDVPQYHWAYEAIKALYDGGYVAGCSTEPLAYCPENGMKRDEASVFVVRGVEGADAVPQESDAQIFSDVFLGVWHTKWIGELEGGGYTDGCGVDKHGERIFCPSDPHTRAEATVFFLRMLHGPEYSPPIPAADRDFVYDDAPVQEDTWYIKWVYAAHDAGLVDGCEDENNQADHLFRPNDVITRAEGACMMARAVGG
jgi:hypothetical protein